MNYKDSAITHYQYNGDDEIVGGCSVTKLIPDVVGPKKMGNYDNVIMEGGGQPINENDLYTRFNDLVIPIGLIVETDTRPINYMCKVDELFDDNNDYDQLMDNLLQMVTITNINKDTKDTQNKDTQNKSKKKHRKLKRRFTKRRH